MKFNIFKEKSISILTTLNTFINHDDFITQVQNYANFYNFQIQKDKVKHDKNNNIKKRTILCLRASVAEQKKEKIIKEIIILKDVIVLL